MTLHPLLKRLAALVSGAALGNLIVLAATPFLTRLYSPDDFGLLATFASASGILGAVGCLRYEQAVYLPRSEGTANLLTAAGLLCALTLIALFSLGATLVLWVSDESALGAWWLAVPLAGGLLAVYNLLSNWAVRRHQVGTVVRTRISRGVAQVGVQGVAGSLGFVPGGLMAGDLVGRFAGVWVLGRLFALTCRPHSLSPRRVRAAMRRYRRFPLLAAPGALVNVLVMQGAPIVLAFAYSPAAAGLYFLVQRLMAAPLALVGQSVAQVLTSELGRKLANGEKGCLRLFLRAVAALALLGGVPLALLGVVAAPYLAWLLGPAWSNAGDYLLILTPFFVGQFIMSPLANFMNTLNRQLALFGWDISRLIVAAPALFVPAGLGFAAAEALLLFSWIMAFFYLGLLLLLGLTLYRVERAI